MASWRDGFKEPETLKATLEFLSAIRTNMLLRNDVCDIFMEMINEYNHTPDPSRIGSFHDLLDLATELRARIIGQKNSFTYGAYGALHSFRAKSHVCDGTAGSCSSRIRRNSDLNGACRLSIYKYATRIADILVKILPKFYFTLLAVFIRIRDETKWLAQKCNEKSGVLYQWFTGSEKAHSHVGCPYADVDKLPRGFNPSDMQSEDPAYRIKDVIFELIEDYGCLRTLIRMLKTSKYSAVALLDNYSVCTFEEDCNKCMCVARKARVIKRATNTANDRSTKLRVNRRVPRVRGRESAYDGSIITKAIPKEKADEQAATSRDVTKASGTELPSAGAETNSRSRRSLKSESLACPVTTTVHLADSGPKAQAITSPSGNQAEVQKTGPGYPNSDIMYFNSPSYSSQSGYRGDYLQDVRVGSEGNTGSNSTLCGAAAGCLLVGCVGFGAAYVFNIGGFGTMVNSLF
ncbi:LPXTG cell wall anchor domain-containing protein [Babesia caballi]|uniref:LPXTG cell wall anchor domain-containing protein n=1 Tax=Babesia caballi TaxID=5871 RepID=A0AAV4M2S2_BABCB|nr:LPXTG cell wall anchor domain-containing protein [Babesia caballi]